MRIVHDNAFDRAVLAVAATQGNYVAANLQNDIKSLTWRSGNTSSWVYANLPVLETISAVILPFCNLSPTAQVRIEIYAGLNGMTQVYDSGYVAACAATRMRPKGLTETQAAGAYELGGGASVAFYFPPKLAKAFTIHIQDPDNLAGSIEVSRVIAGAYFEPKFGANYGLSATGVDSSKNTRSRAGDLLSDAGTTSRKLSFTLGNLKPQDRAEIAKILLENGIRNALWVSLFPQSADLNLERDHQCYGKLTQASAITLPYCNTFSAQVEIESV